MKMTLLEMVQDIMSSMDSDEVNSINDTIESTQVANLIKTTYNDIVSRANLPEHFDVFEMNASNDPTKPTIMYKPENCLSIIWIKYDKQRYGDTESDYQQVRYLEPEEFTHRMHAYHQQNQTDITTFSISTKNSSSFEINVLNNKAPDFWTSYDDNMILFDSYDSEVDTTLMKNKTVVYGEYAPVFILEDSFIPDLDPRQFSLLYNEAKATAFAEMKQVENARAERSAKRAWVTLSHQKSSAPTDYPYFKTLPDYGRKRR